MDDDGAVAEGFGERADAGQGGGGEGVEGAGDVAFAAVDRGAFGVAGIEQAAEFGEEMEVGVEFVEQERGLVEVDDAEQDGGFEVVGAQDFGAEGGQDVHGGGFAVAGPGGSEVEARGVGEGAQGMGVRDPEGADDGGAVGLIAVKEEALEDFVEEARGVEDGLGPGFDLGQFEGVFVGFAFDAAGLDLGIDNGQGQAEALGFEAADAGVFEGLEAGEAVEGVGDEFWDDDGFGDAGGEDRGSAISIFDCRF